MSALETIRFPVAGMTCVSCINRITRSLKKVDGVSKVRVDLAAETATVTRVAGVASDGAIRDAIAEAGYTADLSAARTLAPDDALSPIARLLGGFR